MPRRCCVPGCQSNYGSECEYTTFVFPKDQDTRDAWVRSIHREDFTPTASSVVRVKHFPEHHIVRFDQVTSNGVVSLKKRYRAKLTPEAVPSIFHGQPKYISKPAPAEREGVLRRELSLAIHNEEIVEKFLDDDRIFSFNCLIDKYENKLNCKDWFISKGANYLIFMKVDHSIEPPKVRTSLKILEDFSVKVYNNEIFLSSDILEWILGNDLKCDRWTILETFLSHLYQFEIVNNSDDKLKFALNLLDEYYDDMIGPNSSKLLFLKEQLQLLNSKVPRYSAELMIFACSVYFSNPSAYCTLRESGYLSLPHPNHIRKISTNHDIDSPGFTEPHKRYLQQHLCGLKEEEKLVNVMLDEIHVKSSLQYKGGKIKGSASNMPALANTLQTFMISSLRSSHKDIVAMFPVKNITSIDLKKFTLMTLQALDEIGFKVLALISDNNRLNRKMFELISGGCLKSKIPNPIKPNVDLFLLFDSVHQMKCIRNNWFKSKMSSSNFCIFYFSEFSC